MTEAEAKTQIFEALADYIRAGGSGSNARNALEPRKKITGRTLKHEWKKYLEDQSDSKLHRNAIAMKYDSRTGWETVITILNTAKKFYAATRADSILGGSINTLARETLYFIGEGGDSGEGATGKRKYDSNRHPHSIAMQSGQNKEKPKYEHAIPMKCWAYLMVNHDSKLSDEQIKALIKNNYHIRILTDREDKRLMNQMPDDYDWKATATQPYADIFVRYRNANIKFREGDLVPYSVLDGSPLSNPSSH